MENEVNKLSDNNTVFMNNEQYRAHTRSIEAQIRQATIKIRSELLNEQTLDIIKAPDILKLEISRKIDEIYTIAIDMRDIILSSSETKIRDSALSRIDFSFNTYGLAKQLRQNPIQIASDINTALNASEENSQYTTEQIGPYINFELTNQSLSRELESIIVSGDKYGISDENNNEIVVVDFSSPNIAKPFGVNHLRSTVIGLAVSNLLENSGTTVIRDNHLGDWGTQFGNLLAAYEEFGDNIPFEELSLDQLTELYVRFNNEKKDNVDLVAKGQQTFSKLEQGDKLLLERWLYVYNLSIVEFTRVYERLGIKFDTEVGESYYHDPAKKLVDELAESIPSLVIKDPVGHSVYINSEHPIPLRTGDNYELYAARDLATIVQRQKDYNPNNILYVVGEEQATSFDGVFKLAEAAGLNKGYGSRSSKLEHITFGLLLDENNKKLSTRKGTSGKLEDIIDSVKTKAIEIVTLQNPDLEPEKIDHIAERIAIGAIIWNDLKSDRKTSVQFNVERMLQLQSGTVVDVFYSYARSNSIIETVSDQYDLDNLDIKQFSGEFSDISEKRIVAAFSEYSEILREATNERAPHKIVAYLQALSKLHGTFYERCRVVSEENEAKKLFRLHIHIAYNNIIKHGLNILGIIPPDRI